MRPLSLFGLVFPSTLAIPVSPPSAPLLSRSSVSEGPTPFIGTGKIGLYHDATGDYMGCSTADGLWTVDESQCGTFTGKLAPDGISYEVSSTKGVCATSGRPIDGLQVATFVCGKGVTTDYFALDLGFGHRLGCCGDLYMSYSAGRAIYPTGTEALYIHIWGSQDSGKFVQLGWNATDL